MPCFPADWNFLSKNIERAPRAQMKNMESYALPAAMPAGPRVPNPDMVLLLGGLRHWCFVSSCVKMGPSTAPPAEEVIVVEGMKVLCAAQAVAWREL